MNSEFAPGLPSKESRHPVRKVAAPEVWEFSLQHHLAEKAGPHYDVRLGDPETGHAHSFAMRKEWPKPGEVRLAIPQPTHSIPYMDFKGFIAEGYGKGKVELPRREQTEVVSSSPDHIRFNLYSGKNTEEYLLRKTDDKRWLLRNTTPTRTEELPSSKPKYKELKPDQLDPEKPDKIWQAKVDGAHVLYAFGDTHDQARVFSYRPTERETGVIEHTHRLPLFSTLRTPAALRNSTLRGELIAEDRKGVALKSTDVGGILNAGVWKSRRKQDEMGKLVPYVFDVVKWKGKNVENAPYTEKLEMLQEVQKQAPWLKIPRTATTPAEKKKLFSDIQHHKEKSTEEGLIEWDANKPVPTKAKFKEDEDVFIKEVFPEDATKRQGLAGGFSYSRTPEGLVVGKVGTGFSHAMKKDMLDRPELYQGLKARIQTLRGHAGRAPSFISLHLDQDMPEGVKIAVEEGASDSTGGQYSGNTLNPAGALMMDVARKTENWRPAFKGPPKVLQKTALIHVDSGDVKKPKVSFQSKVEGDAIKMRLAEKDKTLASVVLIDRGGDDGFNIERLQVEPEHRGQGHARALLKELKQWTAKPLYIRPRPFGDMPAGIESLKKFYKSEGFEVVDGKDTMKFKTADWHPQEVQRRDDRYGRLQPPVQQGRLVGAIRGAKSNPKMLVAQLMASSLLNGGPKLAAITVAAFGDELRKLG